jgi:hypothetical protein
MLDDILGRAMQPVGAGGGALPPTMLGWNRRTKSSVAPAARGALEESERAESAERSEAAPSGDEDLVRSMAARLSVLERSQHEMRTAMVSKDRELIRLRAENQALQEKLGERKGEAADARRLGDELLELQSECAGLRAQVREMESFLADYGLVWVGRGASSGSGSGSGGGTAAGDSAATSASPSVLYGGFDPRTDMEHFRSKVQELNHLAGEGQKHVVVAPGGGGRARLQETPSVPLTVFADGIALWRGPFRALTEASTLSFITDILDGYFPAEFKERFPNGCVLQLADRSALTWDEFARGGGFAAKGGAAAAASGSAGAPPPKFSGVGRRAGSGHLVGDASAEPEEAAADEAGAEPPRALPDGGGDRSVGAGGVRSLADLGDPTIDLLRPMAEGEFLRALAPRIVRGGRVIQVREGLKAALAAKSAAAASSSSSSSSSAAPDAAAEADTPVLLADTPALRSIAHPEGPAGAALGATFRPQSRAGGTAGAAAAPSADIATLRVRSESGRQTIVLKMHYDDTIAQLRACIDEARARPRAAYEIRTAYPSRALSDESQTLRHAGLVPNAALLLRATP